MTKIRIKNPVPQLHSERAMLSMVLRLNEELAIPDLKKVKIVTNDDGQFLVHKIDVNV